MGPPAPGRGALLVGPGRLAKRRMSASLRLIAELLEDNKKLWGMVKALIQVGGWVGGWVGGGRGMLGGQGSGCVCGRAQGGTVVVWQE
jgi:hypothetical protein